MLNTGDAGADTLRGNVAAASPGDTIDFLPAVQAGTITLLSPINIPVDVTITGGPTTQGPTITGDATAAVTVPPGSDVTLRNHHSVRPTPRTAPTGTPAAP